MEVALSPSYRRKFEAMALSLWAILKGCALCWQWIKRRGSAHADWTSCNDIAYEIRRVVMGKFLSVLNAQTNCVFLFVHNVTLWIINSVVIRAKLICFPFGEYHLIRWLPSFSNNPQLMFRLRVHCSLSLFLSSVPFLVGFSRSFTRPIHADYPIS